MEQIKFSFIFYFHAKLLHFYVLFCGSGEFPCETKVGNSFRLRPARGEREGEVGVEGQQWWPLWSMRRVRPVLKRQFPPFQ